MSLNMLIETLKLAAEAKLPRVVDSKTPELLIAVRQLFEAGFIHAVDASADRGDCFLEPRITLPGLSYLKS